MRSDTAFLSASDISRRFLAGLASDLLSAAGAAFAGGDARRALERTAGAGAPRICSTSLNALISAWRRSISLWRSAIACAMALMAMAISLRCATVNGCSSSVSIAGRRNQPRVSAAAEETTHGVHASAADVLAKCPGRQAAR